MSQYIKTINYCNHQINQIFNCICSGKKLTFDEAIQLELATEPEIRHYHRPNYTQDWFEIKPGDRLKVISVNSWQTNIYNFIIPKTPLRNLPTTITEFDNSNLESYIHYLTKNCTFTMGL
jgi:hypothetical protein